jgi:hypothetical protein
LVFGNGGSHGGFTGASLAEYILPRRYHFLIVSNTMVRGIPLNNTIVDSTATLAMQTCAAGMWSGLTPPTRPWFKLGVSIDWIELDDDAKAWLEDAERVLYYVFANSNFYNVMAQAFQDVATFGTAPVIMYEDAEAVLRCYLPCSGEYYLAVGSRLTVDTLYRNSFLQSNKSSICSGWKPVPNRSDRAGNRAAARLRWK